MSSPPTGARRTRSAAATTLLGVALLAVALGVGPALAAGSPTTPGVAPAPADVPAQRAEPAAVQADGERAAVEVAASDLGERTVWIGQRLRITGFAGGEAVELSAGEESVRRSADANGTLLLDTGGFEERDYAVEGVESGAGGTLDVRTQTLTASFDPESTDGSSELVLESDRGDYEVALSTDDASASNFDAAFDVGRIEGDRYVVPVEGESARLTFDASTFTFPEGRHRIEVESTDAAASTVANLTVQRTCSGLDLSASGRTGTVGDAVELTVTRSCPSERPFWVTLSDARDRYRVTARVNVTDDRSPVELAWNTHRALDDDAGLAAEGARIADVDARGYYFEDDRGHLEGDVEHRFTATLYRDEDSVDERLWSDRASITLAQRRVDDLTVERAPAGADPPENTSELTALGLSDRVDRTANDAAPDVVTTQDLLLLELEGTGRFGFLGGTPSSLDDAGLSVTFEGPADDAGGRVVANASDAALASDASVVPAPDGDGFVVAVEAGALADRSNTSSSSANASQAPNETLGTWAATLSVGPEYPYADDAPGELTTSFRLVEPELGLVGSFHRSALVLPEGEAATVRTETNVANGTDAVVRIEGPETDREVRTEVVDGEVSANVDLADLRAGDRLSTVAVATPASGLETHADGVVAHVGEFEVASFWIDASAPANATAGGTATLEVDVENRGNAAGDGTIAVAVGGETQDERTVELSPGESWNATYDVDVPDRGTVEWAVRSPHDEATGTIAAADPGERGNRTGPNGSAPAGDADATPGFGAAAALLALLAGAVAHARRR